MLDEKRDLIKGFDINSLGYGMIPKLVMQDRNLHAMAKAIYAYFCSYTGSGDTCFPTRSKICYDLNISPDTFSKHLKNLVSAGYVKVEQIKKNGRFSRNLYTLNDTILPCPKISDTENSVHGKSDTKNNSIKNNKENKNNKILSKKEIEERNEEVERESSVNTNNCRIDKEARLSSPNAPVGVGHGPAKRSKRVEKTRENQKSFDELIDSYTENPVLREELKEHLKTRRAKKAALNNHAIELSLKRLDELTGSTKEKIQIVQNSIINGWTGFYPLSPDVKKRLDKPSYDLSKYEEDDIDPNDDRYVFFDWTPINPDD